MSKFANVKCLCGVDKSICIVHGLNRHFCRDITFDVCANLVCEEVNSFYKFRAARADTDEVVRITPHCFRSGAACHLLGCVRKDGTPWLSDSAVRRHIRWKPGSRMGDHYSQAMSKYVRNHYSWVY